MKSFYTSLAIVVTALLLDSCKPVQRISSINFQDTYKTSPEGINPSYYVFHNSEDLSTLYFKISSDEMYYVQPGGEGSFKSNINVNCRVLPSYNSNRLTDSASVNIIDSLLFESGQYIFDSIRFSTPVNEESVLHITLTDKNQRLQHNSIIRINKTGRFTIQNFIFYDENDEMLFYPFIGNNKLVKIQHNSDSDFVMTGHRYTHEHRVASPPFTGTDYSFFIPDAELVFDLDFFYGAAIFEFSEKGHYHFFIPDEPENGFSIYYLHEGFPYITTHDAMVKPLRYLVSNTEYEKLINSADIRSAIDRFWVGVAGDPGRAASLVNRYYGNVQNANKYFTSYKEGWKTDRGMIYTIFGAPNTVRYTDNIERWEYKDTWRMMELSFDFVYTPHTLSDNHYVLKRSSEYRNPWFSGIENWRK